MRPLTYAAAVAAAALALAPIGAAAASDCAGLAGMTLGNAAVIDATAVSPPFSVTGMDPPRPVTVAAPFCRVQGIIKPTSDSGIRFEVWLPEASDWNGKYQGVGNGGFAGSLIYPSMNQALAAGYAVSGTDTGHTGSPIASGWSVGHPEKVADFGWRAIHETAVVSKAIISAYYRHAAAHAYFSGCSDGGREALMEAQRFPDDYDGIVAGAPANKWTWLVATAVWDEQALAATPGGLPAAKLPAITKAVLAACHGADGYLADPGRCRFDPAVLRCKAGDSNTCLTEPQVAALRRIYAGPHNAAGQQEYPGFEPGSEAGPTAWPLWITGKGTGEGSLQLAFGRGFFGDMVFGNPDWDFRTMNFDGDMTLTEQRTGAAVNATDADLDRFRALGGKLIQYHGWDDPAIPPRSSIEYYSAVAKRLGGIEQTQSFYRLFMAPGMQHCGFGPGPNAVGGVFGLPSPAHDATHDVVAALAHWVEDGVAPAKLVATALPRQRPGQGDCRATAVVPLPPGRPPQRQGQARRRRRLYLRGTLGRDRDAQPARRGPQRLPGLRLQRHAAGQPLGAHARLRLAGHQHLGARRHRPRRLDVVGVGAGAGVEIRAGECLRVEIDRQHAVADAAALAAGHRAGGAAAGQHAGQHLAHERQPRALVQAERDQRPLAHRRIARRARHQRAVQRRRVVGEPPVGPDQRAVRHRLAAVRGDQHLALGDQRGREVEQQHRRGVVAGDADADRVGGEAAVDAAERGDQLAALDIDEMDRDQPRRRRPLRPVADAAEMARVPDGTVTGPLGLVSAAVAPLTLRTSRTALADPVWLVKTTWPPTVPPASTLVWPLNCGAAAKP